MAKLNARNTPLLAACKAKFNAGYYRECLSRAHADPSLLGLWEYVKTLTNPESRADARIQEWLGLADADLPAAVRAAKNAEAELALISSGAPDDADAEDAPPSPLDACKAVLAQLDYLQGLWGKEGVTERLASLLRAAIAGAERANDN